MFKPLNIHGPYSQNLKNNFWSPLSKTFTVQVSLDFINSGAKMFFCEYGLMFFLYQFERVKFEECDLDPILMVVSIYHVQGNEIKYLTS